MSYQHQDQQLKDAQMQDRQVEDALGHFRASMQAWSEHEGGQRQAGRSWHAAGSRWFSVAMMKPALAWGLGCVVAVAGISLPVRVHHERQEAQLRIAAGQERQRQAAAAAAQIAASSMSDEELMNHVDSDIAQSAPDAMEPLASLMTGTTE